MRPQNPYYAALKKALADYRDVAAKNGWPAIPPGPVLKKGSKDRRVPALRQRLAMTGDLDAGNAANPSPVYDEPAVEAVKRFQSRHGLKPGLDAATLEALNVPAAQRLDPIRVNLERARWMVRGTVAEKLKEPVPIVVVYRTVTVIPGDGLAFLPDVYQRDFEVLSALESTPASPLILK